MSRNGGIATTFTAALQARTAPVTGVTLKMLSNRTGYSEDTLANYRDDRTTITGAAIKAIDAALTAYGFSGFMAEVLGLQAARQTAASAAPDPLGAADACWWATHEGTLHTAAHGHGEFARRYFDLPLGTDADPRRFAIDHMGWLAVTRFADGVLQIDGRPERAAPEAVARMADWLERQGAAAISAPGFHLPGGTAAALAQQLRIMAATEQEPEAWSATPLPGIDDPQARALWNAIHDAGIERAHLIETAARAGVLDSCSLFLIDGDAVVSAEVGRALAVDRSVIGRNVLSRRDAPYAQMIRAHALLAKDGPTIHRLTRAAGGGYDRVAFAQRTGRSTWQCLTMSYGLDVPPGFQPLR